nr:DUF5682 family protein [Sphingomonas taxi]
MALREAVDGWLVGLDENTFVANLPLFRRVFAALDRNERRRLIDVVLGRSGTGARGYRLLPGAAAIWPAHETRVIALMTGALR